MDPSLNQQAITQGKTRITALDAIAADTSSSPAAKADAAAAKGQLQKEVALRERVAAAKTPAEQKKAEADLAAYRAKTCPGAEDGSTVAKCRPTVVFVHIHMRFLLPPKLLKDMRDAGKYPRRAANVPADTFKSRFSFEGLAIPTKKRWSGDHPVVGATVTLAGIKGVTDKTGTARFENVVGGSYTLEIEPPPKQSTTLPAGPDLPVRTGYSFDAAPPFMYRPFQVKATIDGEGRWQQKPDATVVLPHLGTSAAYAGVVGATAMDLYLDWKPDWLKIPNRHVVGGRTNKAVVMHQTATTLHEQIGSPIDTFHGGEGTAAHYLADLDGHVVKLVHETEVTYHAANSHWHELVGLNSSGIGIETVHTDSNSTANGAPMLYREFPDEQYAGINRLVTLLRSTFAIKKLYVCGHNDCRDGSRDCPGDMFDWKTLEDASNALKVNYGGAFAGDRGVTASAQTAAAAAVPMSQRLHNVGYTGKTVKVAMERFLVRSWSGTRFDARPKTSLEAGAAPDVALKPTKGKPVKPQVVGQQVTQPVADAIDQMFRDI